MIAEKLLLDLFWWRDCRVDGGNHSPQFRTAKLEGTQMKSVKELVNAGIPVVNGENIAKVNFDKRDCDQIVAVVTGVDGLPAQPMYGHEIQADITSNREAGNRKVLLEFAKECQQIGIHICTMPARVQKWKRKIRQDSKTKAKRHATITKQFIADSLRQEMQECLETAKSLSTTNPDIAKVYFAEADALKKQIKKLKV